MSYPIHEKHEINLDRFKQKLAEELKILEQWFEDGYFTQNHFQLGSEIEYFLIDDNMNLSCKSDEIIKQTPNNVVQEIDNCFLECNTKPVQISNNVLNKILTHLEEDYRRCSLAAEKFNSKLLCIGNCPTTTTGDFERNTTSNTARYNLLQKYLLQNKQHYEVDFSEEVGAQFQFHQFSQLSASLQIHIRVGFDQSVNYYNTAIAIAGPILAACTNSPILFGKPYWMESRIRLIEKLFEAVSSENPRVSFPKRYVNHSWYEVYSEIVEKYSPHFPVVLANQHNPIQHLQLHNGTNYPWIRTIVDFNHQKKPHLRIEFRPLSSGPSHIDMVANMAFFAGLLNASIIKEIELIPFEHARQNFYEAAKLGLDAIILWGKNKPITANDLIINQLLPLAKEGLKSFGVSDEDIKYYLNIIDQRVSKQQTGSHWQLRFLEKNNDSMKELVRRYLELQNSGAPVHEWGI